MNPESPHIPVNIEDEMRSSYLDYAMSVIIGRALPDVRDGLKPVHRRVLYGMYEQSNTWNRAYKKSARIVGDVMGKYHPHGDSAIYDTVVRMAQPFSLRYVLVDGQGNFGSVDGDPAAAMRYTEVRMSRISDELLADIDKETVDFADNYDGSESEPTVLPSKVPNLLVNGATGIAVGMSTNIPPHNLGETIDGAVHLLENPEATIDDLMEIIPAPDFPTRGLICGREGVISAYRTGRGSVRIRARVEIETDQKTERERIVVTEIPYMVNKARLLEKTADLVRQKKIEGISGLRDESDRKGMRVVIELKRDAVADVVLNHLYKHTQLQTSFGVIMLAIVGGQPKLLTLKEVLQHFLDHRREVTTRRCRYELRKAREREHILLGYQIALDNLDRVIELIRGSRTGEEARMGLMSEFALSEIQAQAILDMRLQRLTGLEREKIAEELRQIQAEIARLEEILASDVLMRELIKTELMDVRERYADERRSEITVAPDEISIEDLIAREDMVVTLSHTGYVKRSPVSLYRAQRRGGVGRTGMKTREEDFVRDMFVASTHDYLLVFSNRGRVYWLKVHQIPEAGPNARGKAVVNLVPFEPDEKIAAVLPVEEFVEGRYLLMATRRGVVKKTDLMAFSNVRSSMGIWALSIDEGDELIGVRLTEGNQEVLIGTMRGMAVRFKETDVRPMGRTARGVTGIRFKYADDSAVGMEVLREGATILSVTSNGYGKRTPTEDYRLTGRGAQGVISIDTGDRNGHMVSILQVMPEEDVMLVTNTGNMIRMPVDGIRQTGRNAMGVMLKRTGRDEQIVAASIVAEGDDDEVEGVDGEGVEGEGVDGDGAASEAPEGEEAPQAAEEGDAGESGDDEG